ncbi:hypothetical protein SAMN02745157_0708 [Kaistia soli DSM 19436]|uniref:Bacteriophage lambda head decoration protein D n=1 Tax=Kaistia soli DSM 19436 TaxID=1122133 RepID=A0A1M4VHK3_9HYPH|nr:hypothetical protein [Kaistia soli]SHE68501.1 hypothetical protein SAMN02745157_0708 [Kaistia soli DSM 19436]
MTDLSITPANVIAGSDSAYFTGLAGEVVAAGKAVYLDPTTKRVMLGDSNSATAEAREADGIALNGAAPGQPIVVHKSGDLTLGAVLSIGVAYYLSDTPGGICPVADVGAGEYVCLLGIAKSTSVLAVKIQFPGVTLGGG